MQKLIFITTILCSFIFLSSCEKEEPNTPATKEEIELVKKFIKNDIVLSTKITIGGVDKTILPQGCPTKYKFTWGDDNVMSLFLYDFTIGSMPFKLDFNINNNFYTLNQWERDEYKGDGWVKIKGDKGKSALSSGNFNIGYNGKLVGYINTNTEEIEFKIDFNMMGVKAFIFRQTVDQTRIDRFEDELSQYEKDLEKYKEENGL